MPALVLCGRRTRIASDDFYCPALFLMLYQFPFLLTCVLYLSYLRSYPTTQFRVVNLPFWFCLISIPIYAFMACIYLIMVQISTRGAIADHEQRVIMPKILHVHMIWTGIMFSYGFFGIFAWYNLQMLPYDAKYVLLLAGAMIAETGFWCLFGFCIFSGSTRQARIDSRSIVDASVDNEHAQQQEQWERRCHIWCKRLHCFRTSFFGSSGTHQSSIKAAANILACLFHEGPDLVLSDILAGYMLLAMVQSHEKSAEVDTNDEKHMRTLEAACAGDGITNSNEVIDDDEAITISISATLDTCNDPETNKHILSPTPMIGDVNNAGALEQRIEELAYYSKYAVGAYGWLLYIYTNPWTGIFYLLGSYFLRRRHTSIFGDNLLRLNQSALFLESGITSQDLLYASFRGTVSHPAFYVAFDHHKKELIIAIRGTLSLEDCLTDAMAQHVSVDAIATQIGCDGVGEFAHEGFLQAAHSIYLEIERLDLLKTLSASNSTQEVQQTTGYRVVLVGHSLGAATASLLAVMLKPDFPNLQCFCYSPPGCIMSIGLSDRCKDFITSVVLGHDVVASASVQAAEEFRDRILEVIERSKVSKIAILRRGAASRDINDLLHDSSDDTGRERSFVQHLNRYRQSLRQIRADQVLYELKMPGRIIHLKHKAFVADSPKVKLIDFRCCCRGLAKSIEYDFEWTHHTTFRSIRIAQSMLDDHLANNVHAVLQKCAKSLQVS